MRPFASLIAERLIVLPVRYMRADTIGWAAQAGPERAYLRTVDAEVTFALRERGVTTHWTPSEEVARAARRNPTYAPDPFSLSAEALRLGRSLDRGQLMDPLATQLRSLTAIIDGARYALYPVELRFEGRRDSGRAVLRTVMIDSRTARIVGSLDVTSDSAARLSPATAASLASHLADLVAAP
ncbi:MAG: hypothetical protein NVS1B4_12480 [Gemmatimonadaceae bacterium]